MDGMTCMYVRMYARSVVSVCCGLNARMCFACVYFILWSVYTLVQ